MGSYTHSSLGAFHAVLGLLLLASGIASLLLPKRKRSAHAVLGEAYFWALTVTLGTALLVGQQHPGVSIFEIATPPTFALGLVGYLAVKLKPKAVLGRPWLHWHLTGQGGSFIGVVTASSIQLVRPFAQHSAHHGLIVLACFALPAAIGGALIARTRRRWIKDPKPAPSVALE